MSYKFSIRQCEAGAGFRWIAKGWRLFLKAPWVWMGLGLFWLVVFSILISWVPFLGNVAATLFQAVFLGGMFLAAEATEQGELPTFAHAFAIFRHPRLNALLALGVANLLFSIVMAILFGIGMMIGMAAWQGGMGGWPMEMPMLNPAAYFWGLILLMLAICYFMAVWFAPPLLLFDGLDLTTALRASFQAAIRNIAAFTLYGLAMMLLSLLAILSFGLGLLILIPVVLLSTYCAYREIFQES